MQKRTIRGTMDLVKKYFERRTYGFRYLFKKDRKTYLKRLGALVRDHLSTYYELNEKEFNDAYAVIIKYVANRSWEECIRATPGLSPRVASAMIAQANRFV